MTLLIPLGVAGVTMHLLPVFTAILILLVIVYFSYRQTIVAYPNGGGSYTVASENLGTRSALLAAAALMIDYILTAGVGISAGVTALVSAVPSLHRHQLAMCLLILMVLMIVNMRGVRESGVAFMLPTFLFVGTLMATIGVGVYRVWQTGGHPGAGDGASASGISVDGRYYLVAFAEGVCERMRGDDRCGSSFEWRHGLQGTTREEREHDADGDYCDAYSAAIRDLLFSEGLSPDRNGS